MAFYTREEINKAKSIDLYTYLKNYEPDELVYYNKDTYMTRTHDSLKISNGLWYWFSRGIGGKSALDYLIIVRGMKFLEAVELLLNCSKDNISFINNYKIKDRNIKLILPEKNHNNDKVINYLCGRGIDLSIILKCIDSNLIYESKENHNVVFIGYDKNKEPRYAFIRATNKSRYMHDAYGSNKAFSFRLDSNEENTTVHLFESAIDLLSYATFLKLNNKDYEKENLMSLSGVYQPSKDIDNSKLPIALALYLNNNQNIKRIILHLDNDNAGRLASKGLIKSIPKTYEVVDIPPRIGKDFNDFLCFELDNNFKNIDRGER